MRAPAEGEAHHPRGGRHLHLEGHEQLAPESLDVVVADVATILAKVGRDAVRSGQDSEMGRPDRVRVGTAAGVPDGRDMVDVDAEAQRGNCHGIRFSSSNAAVDPPAGGSQLLDAPRCGIKEEPRGNDARIRRSGPMRPTKRHNFRGCAVWGTTVVPLRGKTSLTRHHIVKPPAMQLRMPHGR